MERRISQWRGDVEAMAGLEPPPGLVAEINDRLDLLERLASRPGRQANFTATAPSG